jgi:hypothetical protein
MKTSNLLKTLTSALFLGAALTGVQADSLLRDGDFNALPVSTAPDIGKAAGRWHFDSVWAEGAPSLVSIVPAPAGGDGKCLLMSLAATETVDAEPEVLHQFSAVNRSIDKIINMSFDIYVEPGRGGGDTSIAQGSLGSERVVHLRWNSDGTLYNRVPSGVAPLFPYPRGVWQSVRVELDLYNNRYNLHWSEKASRWR